MAFRMQPHRDVLIIRNRTPQMDPSVFPPGQEAGHSLDEIAGASAMLMDATRKWDYPPVSLPKKEYMERAKQLWERLELPKLKPQDPWFGYNLGLWSEEDEAEAQARGQRRALSDRREAVAAAGAGKEILNKKNSKLIKSFRERKIVTPLRCARNSSRRLRVIRHPVPSKLHRSAIDVDHHLRRDGRRNQLLRPFRSATRCRRRRAARGRRG